MKLNSQFLENFRYRKLQMSFWKTKFVFFLCFSKIGNLRPIVFSRGNKRNKPRRQEIVFMHASLFVEADRREKFDTTHVMYIRTEHFNEDVL